MFASVLPVGGINFNKQIHHINTWLWDWCNRQNFGFVDYGKVYTTPCLLAPLSEGEKDFCSEVGRADRALN